MKKTRVTVIMSYMSSMQGRVLAHFPKIQELKHFQELKRFRKDFAKNIAKFFTKISQNPPKSPHNFPSLIFRNHNPQNQPTSQPTLVGGSRPRRDFPKHLSEEISFENKCHRRDKRMLTTR